MPIGIDIQNIESIEIKQPTSFEDGAWFSQKVHIKTDRDESLTITLFANNKSVLLKRKGKRKG